MNKLALEQQYDNELDNELDNDVYVIGWCKRIFLVCVHVLM